MGQDVPSKNPGAAAAATEGFDVTRTAVSFGYFSLGQQRKVTRRKAKAVAFVSSGKAGPEATAKSLDSRLRGNDDQEQEQRQKQERQRQRQRQRQKRPAHITKSRNRNTFRDLQSHRTPPRRPP